MDAQISNILALLQKIENKYSVTSKQVIVENVSISVVTVFSGEIDSPLVEENSSHMDNIEGLSNIFINDFSGQVYNKLDEMPMKVFTKEIEETSSVSSCVADLDDSKSPKVFNECFPGCCTLLVAEVQADTPNKMLAKEASGPKHIVAQLIDECSPKDMSKSGHRRVEECTVAQQIQLAKLRKIFDAAMRSSLLARSRAFLVIIREHNHHYSSLLCETPMEVKKKCRLRDPGSFSYLQQSYCYEITNITNAHEYINIMKVLEIIRHSKKEQMKIFRIMASIMVLGNMGCSKGNETASSILQVDSVWFQLHTTIAVLYTYSSIVRFHIILSVWLYSNLEDKVLIEDESIVMDQVQPNMNTNVTQVVIGLTRLIAPRTTNRSSLIWDPGRVVGVKTVPLNGVVVSNLGIMHIEENVCSLLFF
ncbi:hypothetical protein MTR67_005426 [Solanum verrucosum]|uniref:Myosin motor domain-containing protein n=1 Tax=Solanum verrucosum TaxID=315347 RepID=A0AAF0Q0T7_SOLVR|nr:hypothetical protein MTR67_005426 [Solanum verrucosum]